MDKEQKKDIAYSVVKATLGSVPLVGAAASELLQLIVTPPIEKRREKWTEEVGKKLQELESKESINLESLRENDVFVDVVLQATQEALKTSEQEKIEYFKNVIINSTLEEAPDLSEIKIFLNFISDFTVWHIRILKLFDDPEEWFENNDKSIPNMMGGSLSSILEIAYPELTKRKPFYNLIWSDLERAGLHNTSGLQTMMSGSGLTVSRTTDFGKKLLDFISNS